VQAQSEAIRIGTYGRITVVAPLADMSKAQVVEAGLNLANPPPFAETYSCYVGEKSHCGECATCIERVKAFKIGGIKT
jgi:7-cyano-7-deazaguanine synthase